MCPCFARPAGRSALPLGGLGFVLCYPPANPHRTDEHAHSPTVTATSCAPLTAPAARAKARGWWWLCCACCHGQATYGFLYLEYGPNAWWWEVEELVRKLLLSSLVVLIDAGSPLQVQRRPHPRWLFGLGVPCVSGVLWRGCVGAHPARPPCEAVPYPHPLASARADALGDLLPTHAHTHTHTHTHTRTSIARVCGGAVVQVTLAVLVCGWAHVLHAVFKPWGAGTTMYALQHGSLALTSFVFLMGLLFKVRTCVPRACVGLRACGWVSACTHVCEQCMHTCVCVRATLPGGGVLVASFLPPLRVGFFGCFPRSRGGVRAGVRPVRVCVHCGCVACNACFCGVVPRVCLGQVEGVSQSSPTYSSLAGLMLALCALFGAAWLAALAVSVYRSSVQVVASSKSAARRAAAAAAGKGTSVTRRASAQPTNQRRARVQRVATQGQPLQGPAEEQGSEPSTSAPFGSPTPGPLLFRAGSGAGLHAAGATFPTSRDTREAAPADAGLLAAGSSGQGSYIYFYNYPGLAHPYRASPASTPPP